MVFSDSKISSVLSSINGKYDQVSRYNSTTKKFEHYVKNSKYDQFSCRLKTEILTAKAKLICSQIKDAAAGIVPFGEVNTFMVAGRTVLLEGFIEMLENSLGVSVKLARLTHPDIITFTERNEAISGQKGLTYITALGIICEALPEQGSYLLPSQRPTHNPILKLVNKFKEIYQEYF